MPNILDLQSLAPERAWESGQTHGFGSTVSVSECLNYQTDDFAG